MELVFFVGLILHLFFGIYLGLFSIYTLKRNRIKKLFLFFLLLSLSFFVVAIFHVLWAFSHLEFSILDISLISSILFFFRIIVLLIMFSYLLHSNSTLSTIFAYVLVFLSIYVTISISFIVLSVSFFILLIVSLILYSKKDFHKVGIFGIVCSLLSFITLLLLYFGYGNILYILFALDILFFLFLFQLVLTIKNNSSIVVRLEKYYKEHSVVFDFIKYFVFIFILVNVIFISTVVIHEFGHFFSAQYFDCGYSRIVYETGLPHTELLCGNEDPFNFAMTSIIGILLPILISLFFFFSGGTFIKELGVLIIGFSLLISYRDLIGLGFSETFSLFVSIVGFITVLFAVLFLISSRAQEEQFIAFTEGYKSFNKKGNRR